MRGFAYGLEKLSPDELLDSRDLPGKLTLRPSLTLSPVRDPLLMKLCLLGIDSRSLSEMICHLCDIGLRQMLLDEQQVTDSNMNTASHRPALPASIQTKTDQTEAAIDAPRSLPARSALLAMLPPMDHD